MMHSRREGRDGFGGSSSPLLRRLRQGGGTDQPFWKPRRGDVLEWTDPDTGDRYFRRLSREPDGGLWMLRPDGSSVQITYHEAEPGQDYDDGDYLMTPEEWAEGVGGTVFDEQ